MARNRRQRQRGKSVLTKNEFHLNKHDEEKVLLFVSGILFGVGISVAIVTSLFWFSSLAIAVIGLVLFLIEYRQEL